MPPTPNCRYVTPAIGGNLQRISSRTVNPLSEGAGSGVSYPFVSFTVGTAVNFSSSGQLVFSPTVGRWEVRRPEVYAGEVLRSSESLSNEEAPP